MSEHTPGPWEFCGLNKRWGIYPTSAVNDGIDYFIATTRQIGDPEREKANGRLIAASPTMLEILCEFVAWADGAENGWACPADLEAKMRAVIASQRPSTD